MQEMGFVTIDDNAVYGITKRVNSGPEVESIVNMLVSAIARSRQLRDHV